MRISSESWYGLGGNGLRLVVTADSPPEKEFLKAVRAVAGAATVLPASKGARITLVFPQLAADANAYGTTDKEKLPGVILETLRQQFLTS